MIDIDVIIVCEESQTIAKEFDALGFKVRSVDLQSCSGGRPDLHLQMDAFEALRLYRSKLLIGNPPCTFTSSAGLHWCNIEKHGQKAIERIAKRDAGVKFFLELWNQDIPMICLENPAGFISSSVLKPSQRVDPYFFGDPHRKRTMLWMKNLPKLIHIKEDDLFYTHTHTHRNLYQSIRPVKKGTSQIRRTDHHLNVQKLFPASQKQWRNNGLFSYEAN